MALQTITATWVAPTTNTDGSAISAGEITGYQIDVAQTLGGPSITGTPIQVGPTVLSYNLSQISALVAGTQYYAAVQALTANGPGVLTAAVPFTTAMIEVPSAPTSFSVA